MAAAADVSERRITIQRIANASSSAAAAASTSTPSLVVTSTVRFEQQQAADAFAVRLLQTDGEAPFLTTIFSGDFALEAFAQVDALDLNLTLALPYVKIPESCEGC